MSKIGKKLSLILLVLLFELSTIVLLRFSHILEKKVVKELDAKASLAIEMMNAVRTYTSLRIKPELEERANTETTFLPETVPAYSAREVFENLTSNREYRDFSYKEATINPTNLRDKADRFEAALVEKFRENRNLIELKGFRKIDDETDRYYLARPLIVNSESCLECHGNSKNAPPGLLSIYGDSQGFNWELNEVVAAQVITVPIAALVKNPLENQWSLAIVILLALAVVVLLFNFFLERIVVRPIKKLSQICLEGSTGIDNWIQKPNNYYYFNFKDEIGFLAKIIASLNVNQKNQPQNANAREKLESNR